jgi:predicted hydrocarbon binding protein
MEGAMSGSDEFSRALKNIFGNAEIDLDKGLIEIQGNRVVMLFAETLVATQKRMETLIGIDTAAMLIYESYKEYGKLACEIERKIVGDERGKTIETIKSGLIFGRMLCWGQWEMSSFEKLSTTFIVRDSPIAKFYGGAKRAVCHPIRGTLAGFAERLIGQKRDCVEIRCKAKGGDYCEFLVASPENITKLTLERLKEDDSKIQ